MRTYFLDSLNDRLIVSLARGSQCIRMPVSGRRFRLWIFISFMFFVSVWLLTWRIDKSFQNRAIYYNTKRNMVSLLRAEIGQELSFITTVEDTLFSFRETNNYSASVPDTAINYTTHKSNTISY